jgi:small subunit ribosomal protein S8
MDYISNLLTAIRNSEMASKPSLKVPHSKMNWHILEILKSNKIISDFKEIEEPPFKKIEINLIQNSSHHLKRISKPGRRIYSGSSGLKPVLSGKGFMILSTSQGVMSSREARKRNLGGEILCEIY